MCDRPYWATDVQFISECKFRNPFRNRKRSGHCMICGGEHPFRFSDDTPLTDCFCPSCSAAIKTAMQKYKDLSKSDQDDMFGKEVLEMMVALDLEDGVISLDHAKEDYSRIEAMMQSLARGRVWSEEERQREEERKQQEIENKNRAISRGRDRSLS